MPFCRGKQRLDGLSTDAAQPECWCGNGDGGGRSEMNCGVDVCWNGDGGCGGDDAGHDDSTCIMIIINDDDCSCDDDDGCSCDEDDGYDAV